MLLRNLLGVFCLLFLASCATGPRHSTKSAEAAPEVQLKDNEVSSQVVVENISKPYVSPLGSIPMDQHPLVEQWVKYFNGRGRKHMEVYLERSSRYMPMMKNVLRENGLPEELVYVALIESGFSPRAHSRANAVGYWQFIRETGRRYGLKVDSFVDERRDPVLSTRAAAEYFKALYSLFGSWHLSLAAYNSGENRIKKAVMKKYSRDFWQLVEGRRVLPKETKHYVPKFIAAAMIAENPSKYGFTAIDYQKSLAYDTVTVQHAISLKQLAQNLNVSEEELRLLNPKFRGDYVPLYRGNEIVLRVPSGYAQAAIAAAASAKVEAAPNIANSDYIYYRIRPGDSLSTIARKFRTSVATLRNLNDLGSRSFLRVGRKLMVPDRGDYYYQNSGEQQYAMAEKAQPEAVAKNVSFHIVKRGENLSSIARMYGTSVEELRRLNSLGNRAVLSVGQRLRVKEDEKVQNFEEKKLHTVKRGENLTTIAQKYKVSLNEILANNKLKRKALHVGQKLTIANKKRVHTVRRGETLTHIADKYRVAVSKLVQVNDLRNRSRLLAGRTLVIPE